MKLLYGLAEARNYWFVIYLDYPQEKLEIEMSLYAPFLFITKDVGKNFGIIEL